MKKHFQDSTNNSKSFGKKGVHEKIRKASTQ